MAPPEWDPTSAVRDVSCCRYYPGQSNGGTGYVCFADEETEVYMQGLGRVQTLAQVPLST